MTAILSLTSSAAREAVGLFFEPLMTLFGKRNPRAAHRPIDQNPFLKTLLLNATGIPLPTPRPPIPQPEPDPLQLRLLKYVSEAAKHRLAGLASYYSTSLDGTLTANGERYHNKKMSVAHLTLPLGSWVEITSRATGQKLRLQVNDRGPYVNKFVIDLPESAARLLGIDVAKDRSVLIRIIALPGEEPLPEEVLDGTKTIV